MFRKRLGLPAIWAPSATIKVENYRKQGRSTLKCTKVFLISKLPGRQVYLFIQANRWTVDVNFFIFY